MAQPHITAALARRSMMLWFYTLASVLFLLLLPSQAKALEALTVTSSNEQALGVTDLQVSFTATENLSSSDSNPGFIYIRLPESFQINSTTSFFGVEINGENWGANGILTILDGGSYKDIQIRVPYSIAPGDAVVIKLTDWDNSITVRNPWTAGTYVVSVSADGLSWTDAPLSVAYTSQVSGLNVTYSPEEIIPRNSNSWNMAFITSRPLTAGDVIHISFPEEAELNFNTANIVGWYGETRAFWINGQDPGSLTISGSDVSIPVPATLTDTNISLSIDGDAVINPLAAGPYTIHISTTSDSDPYEYGYTVSPSQLSISATSNKQYAKHVDYTLTFRPRSVVDSENRLVLSFPSELNTELTTANVSLNGIPPESVGADGFYYIAPAAGQSFSTTDTITLTIRDVWNPEYNDPLTFGLTTDNDFLTDYAIFQIEAAAAPEYDPSTFGHSLSLSQSKSLKIQSGEENNFGGANDFTIGMWVKPDWTYGVQTLYHKSWGAPGQLQTWLYLEDGKLKAGLDNFSNGGWTWIESAASIPAGQWSHVALIKSGTYAQLYVNGHLEAEVADGPFAFADTSYQPVFVGIGTDGDNTYSGLIDDLQIWNQALYEDQLLSYMFWGEVPYYSFASGAPASQYQFEPETGVLSDSYGTRPAEFMMSSLNELHVAQNIGRNGILPNPREPEPVTYSIVQNPAHGSVSLTNSSTGEITFTPETDYTGDTDSFVYGVIGDDGVITLETVELLVEPNPYGADSANSELTSLLVNGAQVPLVPGETTVHMTVPAGQYSVLIHASGDYGQHVTIGNELITAAAGKDWDLSEGDNLIPILVESFDHSTTQSYTLRVYLISSEENAKIQSALDSITDAAILGSNTSLDHVTASLLLGPPVESDGSPMILPDGFAFQWETSNASVISDLGYVNRSQLTSPAEVELKAVISHGGYRAEKSLLATVHPNQAPVITSSGLEFVSHGEILYGSLHGYDPDGDYFWFTAAPGQNNESFMLYSDGSFTYQPQAGYVGEDRITVNVSDGSASSSAEIVFQLFDPASTAAQLLSLDVMGTPFPLVEHEFEYHLILPQETVSFPVQATGRPGQIITINGMDVLEANLPLDDTETAVKIHVQADNSSEYRDYLLVVKRENDEQRVHRIYEGITEHAILGANLSKDEITGALNLHLEFIPQDVELIWTSSESAIDAETGAVTRPAGVNVPVLLTLTVTKDVYSSPSKSFKFTVIGTNSPPTAYDGTFIARNEPAAGQLQGTDPESQSLAFSLLDYDESKAVVQVNGDGSFIYEPLSYSFRTDTFTYKVSDGEFDSAPATVTIQIYGPHSSMSDIQGIRIGGASAVAESDGVTYTYTLPYETSEAQLLAEGYPGQSIAVNGTGINGEAFTIPAGNSAFVFRITSEDGSSSNEYTLNLYRDTLDEYLQKTLELLSDITILGPGNPDFSHITAALNLRRPESMPANVTLEWTSAEPWIDAATGEVSRPIGEDVSFVLTAGVTSDGVSQTKTYPVTVLGLPNTAPFAGNAAFTVDYSETLAKSVPASDPDQQQLTFTVISPPVYSASPEAFRLNPDGTFLYTPNAGLTESVDDSFTYKVSDGLEEAIGTVSIHVYGPYKSNAGLLELKLDGESALQTGTDAYDWRIFSGNSVHVLAIGHAGQTIRIDGADVAEKTVTLDSDSITVYVDVLSEDRTAEKRYTILIHKNRAPEAATSSFILNYGQTLMESVNGSDPDEDPLSYSILSGPVYATEPGSFVMNEDGTFHYTPSSGLTATVQDSFTYKVSDGFAEATGTVTLLVYGPMANSADISSIQVNGEARASAPYDYNVSYNTANADVRVAGLPGQLISIDGIAGNARAIDLNYGSNSVRVNVTSEDRLTSKEYILSIFRETVEPVAPILSSLLAGPAENELAEITVLPNVYGYQTTVTGSTYVYVKPAAATGAIVTVKGQEFDGITPIKVPLQDYQSNTITIDVVNSGAPALRTFYTLTVQADSGLASVTGAAYEGAQYPAQTGGNRIDIANLPYGSYAADIRIHTLHPDAKVLNAWLTGSATVTYDVYQDHTIRIPLGGTPVDASFIVQDRNGKTKMYRLMVTQGEAPPPQFPIYGFSMTGATGLDLTIGFDLALSSVNLGKIRYKIGETFHEMSLSAASYSIDNRSLKIKLKEPILNGAHVAVVLEEGAATSTSGGISGASSGTVVNLSMVKSAGGAPQPLDVESLLQMTNLEALPPAAIYQALNLVSPRFLNR